MKGGWLLLAFGGVSTLFGAGAHVTGKVVDENQVAVPGASISIADHAALSDHAGAFQFQLDAPGDYQITAQREGYFVLRNHPVRLEDGENLVTLVLNNQREVLDSVEVSYSPPAVNPEETAATEKLTGTELLNIPYPSTNNLKNALPLIPGVVQDSRGSVHIQGGSSDQTFWTLDGFNITDPLTGRFESRLSVDGIRAIELNTGRYSAETGKGSAGAVQIRTAMGDDQWRRSATNFIPSVEGHKNKGLVLSNWTPRATVAGPLARGRAWFSDAMDVQYDLNVVEELPAGQDRNVSWRTSNLMRSQVNLRPSNIFTASWLLNYWNAPRNGLGFLDPLETTVDRRSHQNFVSFKDQAYLGEGLLLEVGYAATRGVSREAPQGHEAYVFTPDGRRGNFFLGDRRRSGRDQWLANVFFPSFSRRGSHQIKAGLDLDRVTYYQWVDRHAYEFYRSTGTLSRRVDFAGSNQLWRKNFEASSYVLDRWKLGSRLLVEAGVRLDWDQIIRQPALSPRVGFSLAVPGLENTKVAAGWGLFHDATNLRVLSRHLDQYSIARYYAADGRTLLREPAASVYLLHERDLRVPVYHNWSAGVEHLFPRGFHARMEYLRKRGYDGFSFVNSLLPGVPTSAEVLAGYGVRAIDGLYLLWNVRRDTYDSVEVSVRKTFRRQSEWFASYTRSRALSNAVVDVNVDDPLLVDKNVGRLPWDTPNRFLSWGVVPIKEKNALSYSLEVRDGYVFNVSDEEGRLVGKLNDRRFPFYFNVNLHWERKFALGRYLWAWRAGFNNLTNRLNPTTVNSNASSTNFLRYFGGQHRAFVMRIRWLGPKPK